MADKHYLAFDLGASSGRALSGTFDGTRLQLEEIHRFPNQMIGVLGHLHWDVLNLFVQMKTALGLWARRHGRALDSVGVDTWGVDFALLGRHQTLLGLPYAYRDPQTEGVMEQIFKQISREEIFDQTGIQFMPFNTLYQLYALKLADSPLLDVAEQLITIPDLFNLFLTGEVAVEFTHATTTQFYNPRTGDWAWSLLERLNLPGHLLVPVVSPGTRLGCLLPELAAETGLGPVAVIAPACHDTGSAVAAVPAEGEDWAYISSGTWSLMGIETPRPIISARALQANFTNEGGVGGTYRFLKNIAGLWLLQTCRQAWARQGEELTYAEITRRAESAPPFRSLVDPDAPDFLNPPHMPKAIAAFCRRSGQPVPVTPGALARCVFESLALKYRLVLDLLTELRGKPLTTLHIVGGGTQNALLNQFAANATGLPVVAGPVEATAIGNLLIQAVAQGDLGSLPELREVVRTSFPLQHYQPRDQTQWQAAYHRFQTLFANQPS